MLKFMMKNCRLSFWRVHTESVCGIPEKMSVDIFWEAGWYRGIIFVPLHVLHVRDFVPENILYASNSCHKIAISKISNLIKGEKSCRDLKELNEVIAAIKGKSARVRML